MSLTVIERFKARKRVSSELKVEFFPTSSLEHYCTEVLGMDAPGVESLSDEQKADAKERYQELDFYFNQMSDTEKRGLSLELIGKMQGDPVAAAQKIQSKLIQHFKRAEHKPKDGSEPLQIGKKEFEQIASMLSYIELIELLGAYQEAIKQDELAAKNALTAERVGSMQ